MADEEGRGMTATPQEVEAMAAVLCSAFDAVGEDPSFIEAAADHLASALVADGWSRGPVPGSPAEGRVLLDGHFWLPVDHEQGRYWEVEGITSWDDGTFSADVRPVAAAPAESVWGAGSEYNDAAAWEPAAVGGPGDPEATTPYYLCPDHADPDLTCYRCVGDVPAVAGQPGKPEDRP